MQTFARWVSTPETKAARLAVGQVVDHVVAGRPRSETNPLFLYGASGCGKTHLIAALAHELALRHLEITARIQPARELADYQSIIPSDWHGDSLIECDLLAVEDLQHLPTRASETLVRIIDERLSHQLQTVLTANVGPAQLDQLPSRLTSRLVGGLVVGLTPLGPASRLVFLRDRIERRQLPLGHEVLTWLAEHLPGSCRQLDGAVTRVESLVRHYDRIPDLAVVAEHFRAEVEAGQATVERITEEVSRHFHVDSCLLRSKQRSRGALRARQVAMTLTRRLTSLSLEQIGAYFGGRDHSTVLHACHKVESTRDPVMSGALRQLQAELV
jgi:chromosomal replication initiator protein